MAYLFIFALQCLFPIFDPDAGGFTGLSIVNTDTRPQTFTVSVTASDGSNLHASLVTLNPGAQRAALLNEIVPAAPSSGWIRVAWPGNSCTSYLTSGTNRALAGLEGAPEAQNPPPVTTLILPHVSINTGFTELGHTDTFVAIVNPSTATTSVNAELFGTDGVLRGTVPLPVPLLGSRTFRLSETFQAALPNNGLGGKTFYGYLRLTSNTPVSAWQRIETPLSRSVLRGKRLDEIRATSLAMAPHFVFGGGYDSVLNLVNSSSSRQTLELTAYNDQGRKLGDTLELALDRGEAKRDSVAAIFKIPIVAIFPPPVISGYIRIRNPQGQSFQITGDVEITGSNGGQFSASMLSPLSDDAGSTVWTLPFATSAGGYFTGYVIANPNELLTVQSDVEIEVLNPDGTIQDRRRVQLSPLNRIAALVPSGISSGYLRFRSMLPVQVMGSIGTHDLQQFDQVPALKQ